MLRKIKLLVACLAALSMTGFASLALALVLPSAAGLSTVHAQEPPPASEQKFARNDCRVPLSEVNNEDGTLENDCGIIRYLLIFINALSALVGVVIVGVITVGGIQYSTAADNPQATMAAKKRIGNAIAALLLYIFMFSFLQWLVPGGIF